MEAMYWLIFFAILVVIEIITLGLTTIWFAGGALVAFVTAVAGGGIGIQLILFFIVSLILLFGTRPIAVKYINKDRTKTNIDSLIGNTAIVTESIDNIKAKGAVSVNGQEWTARSSSDDILIARDRKVTILRISGVKLIVNEELEEM